MVANHWRVILVVLVICGLAAVFSRPGSAESQQAENSRDGSLSELSSRINKLETEKHMTDASVSWLSNCHPPVGSVVAFVGPWPPPKPTGGQYSEGEIGWMLCDGDRIDEAQFPQLAAVLRTNHGNSEGSICLPNLQGQFLRGIVADRTPGHPEPWATGMPRQPFVTATGGEHNHHGEKGTSYGLLLRAATLQDGDVTCKEMDNTPGEPVIANDWQGITNHNGHTHEVTGGDPETRPSNIAVHWIIKAKAER